MSLSEIVAEVRRKQYGLVGRVRALFHGLGPKGAQPSRGRVCTCRWCTYDRTYAKRIRWVLPWERYFFDALKEDWEAAEHTANYWQRRADEPKE